MKQEIELFICEKTSLYDGTTSIFVATEDYSCIDGYILLGKQTVAIDVPEVDTRSIKVEALKAKKQKILAENEQLLNKVDDEINKLLAIEVA